MDAFANEDFIRGAISFNNKGLNLFFAKYYLYIYTDSNNEYINNYIKLIRIS